MSPPWYRSVPWSTCGWAPMTSDAPSSMAALARWRWMALGVVRTSNPAWKKTTTWSATRFAAMMSRCIAGRSSHARPAVVSVAIQLRVSNPPTSTGTSAYARNAMVTPFRFRISGLCAAVRSLPAPMTEMSWAWSSSWVWVNAARP